MNNVNHNYIEVIYIIFINIIVKVMDSKLTFNSVNYIFIIVLMNNAVVSNINKLINHNVLLNI